MTFNALFLRVLNVLCHIFSRTKTDECDKNFVFAVLSLHSLFQTLIHIWTLIFPDWGEPKVNKNEVIHFLHKNLDFNVCLLRKGVCEGK